MAASEVSSSNLFLIDEVYEFSAPRFYDFLCAETDEDVRKAELWFENALSHAPSPFMPKIKATRNVRQQILCDFGEGEKTDKAPEPSEEAPNPSKSAKESTLKSLNQTCESTQQAVRAHNKPRQDLIPAKTNKNGSGIEKTLDAGRKCNKENENPVVSIASSSLPVQADRVQGPEVYCTPAPQKPVENTKTLTAKKKASILKNPSALNSRKQLPKSQAKSTKPASVKREKNARKIVGTPIFTHENHAIKRQKLDGGKTRQPVENTKTLTAKKKASILKNPSALNSRKQLPKSQAKSTKPASVKREKNARKIVGTPIFTHENHAIKRQKLDGGKTRQILTVNKSSNLPHKTRTGVVSNSSDFCPSTAKTKTNKEDRMMYVRDQAAQPFVSMAEMMRKFQSGTRESRTSSISHSDAAGNVKAKTKLTLTRPKTPEFETSQRVRSVKIKSSAELEEEIMAKIPKFKARPLNKKIFEASTLPPLPRSTLHPPEFKEFHLETMSRANHNAETSTVASTESTAVQGHQWKPHHLTAPKSPHLQTSLRARPPKVKTSEELEKEELENIPQFKARPLNKKIFESKGEMGMFCNMKKQVTIPEEFHFAIDKRIPPPSSVFDLFDKLSINSELHQEKPLARNTTPNPFHLHTEERGARKEKRLAEELLQKQLEDERAKIPRAHPYPYTTDYPVIPPKPEPKPCTKPEPFQLESLLRHEEEMQREMEERRRMEFEEAEIRRFKAQPILKEDPIPLPVKERKPLTEVQKFNLHVEHRAVDRSEFDKKIKEKETVYKRYREEAESAKMMEEEKALKQLRRTLVPHARPVPSFEHPFFPQKSVKVATKANSPYLRVNHRNKKRASGAIATHIR